MAGDNGEPIRGQIYEHGGVEVAVCGGRGGLWIESEPESEDESVLVPNDAVRTHGTRKQVAI